MGSLYHVVFYFTRGEHGCRSSAQHTYSAWPMAAAGERAATVSMQ